MKLGEIANNMAPLAGILTSREAGMALASAYTALAKLAPHHTNPAEVMRGLTAVSTTAVSTILVPSAFAKVSTMMKGYSILI